MTIKITPITNRLFQVENIFDEQVMETVNTINWLELPWHKGDGHEEWKRRRINLGIPEVVELNKMMQPFIEKINEEMSMDINTNTVTWWLDEPGFTCGIHVDQYLPKTIQVYMICPNEEVGTSFYKPVKPDRPVDDEFIFEISQYPLYTFKSIPNTGYIMLNYPDSDGSTPLLWHDMHVPVPDNCIRLSCYYNILK